MIFSGTESSGSAPLEKIAALYLRMEEEYGRVADQHGFSCKGCLDNCCDSFFLHYTYIEWAHLQTGLRRLSPGRLKEVTDRAIAYVREAAGLLARGERPQIMCPLNEQGLCALYPYRTMLCRLHGVPAEFSRPDGKRVRFPGCFRCQELTDGQERPFFLERTDFYRELVALEREYVGLGQGLSRVRLTIAQMIVQGVPPTGLGLGRR